LTLIDQLIPLAEDADEEKYNASKEIMIANMKKFYKKFGKNIKSKPIETIDRIDVYTDGSLRRTKKGILCGYGVYFPGRELPDIAQPFTIGKITNNRAELFAILQAIKNISSAYTFDRINVYTDSEYSQKSLTVWVNSWKKNNWKNSQNKPVDNRDIIEPIHEYMRTYMNKIKIIWVKSHTGKNDPHSLGNSMADELANKGAVLSGRF
jgi:ribonuclease HI